jgi:translation initiation factor 2B subunit (eIF-2B alpha/beta/delta family)
MSDALDKVSAAMQQQQAATISNAAAVLQSGMCVLTTSLSSTVAKALIQAHQRALEQQPSAAPAGASTAAASFKGGSNRGPGLSVIVCESRPLCEGVTMAQRLAAAGLQVTLITDAQAGVFVEQADVVLLGADAVTPAGVVNKVGSKLLARAAKAADVPVVAVTDSLKVSPGPVSQFALPNTLLQVSTRA